MQKNKKIIKNYNFPRTSYIFDVGPMLLPFKNCPMNFLISLDEF